jgi:PAS domain S-box-containing protein
MLIHGQEEVLLVPAPPPAAPEDPTGTASLSDRAPDAIILAGGLLCIGVGLLVIAAWFARATVILTFGSQNPMSFNTALALVVTGVALVALTRKRSRAALAAGAFDLALGLAVLAEYVFGTNLGIDQLIVKAYIAPPHVVPGRSAVNTAVCLVLAGAGLLAWGPWRRRRRPAVLAATACVIGVIASVAAFGYATGNLTAYGWWHVSAMALLTSVSLLVLALGLLTAAWKDSRARHAGLPRWLPMPVGALVLGLAIWQAIVGRAAAAEHISQGTFTSAATVLGLILAGSAALVVWAAQRAEGRRRAAVATTVQRAEAERQARESEHRLFQFLEAMPVAVFIASRGGRPYFTNSEAERVLGQGVAPGIAADELAETYRVFLAGTNQPFPTERMAIARSLSGQRSHFDDMEIHKPDGSVVPLEVWGHPVYGADGEIDYAINAFADISKRHAREKIIAGQAALLKALNESLEQRVQQRTVHLERANKQLTAFTYSVAHDLRTPLRGISGFAEALVEEYGDRLDNTGRGYAGRIQAASGRMSAVLDDLLHLSWVSRVEMELQGLDLSAEVAAICDLLRARDPDRRVRVTVQDGVHATADRTLIRTALEKLLDNAWKFTVGQQDATIEFASAEVDEAPRCCFVRDNGAGFDLAYADKLFQPFQRLHAAGEYPGTGIGLASVQRIIDRHGGRVWAEGAVGRGATFYFTLNAKDTLINDHSVPLAEDNPKVLHISIKAA